MIRVYQTIVDREHGNCMQAAIASLFNKSFNEVPNFKEFGGDWWEEMMKFVREQGYEFDGTLYNYNQYRIINKRIGVQTAKGLRNRFQKLKNMKQIKMVHLMLKRLFQMEKIKM